MKLEIQIAATNPVPAEKRTRKLELTREGSRWMASIDGRPVEADVAEVTSNTYSVIVAGRAFEVRVQPSTDGLRVQLAGQEFAAAVLDPRAWRGKRAGTIQAEGRQQISAPMPGKVVRVLVKTGEEVQAGQGVVVVEAMKMQNEIRAPKTGTIEKLHVTEGQAVNAGEVLAVVA